MEILFGGVLYCTYIHKNPIQSNPIQSNPIDPLTDFLLSLCLFRQTQDRFHAMSVAFVQTILDNVVATRQASRQTRQ
jgi:hypothetical protein